jgi:hypothetical protein
VFQVTVPRDENITEMGMPLLPAMGVVTVLNFQPTSDGKAAITGDFVLIDKEVNAVAARCGSTVSRSRRSTTSSGTHRRSSTCTSGATTIRSSSPRA